MRVIEKVLASILVISAVVITFHATNTIADDLLGPPPRWRPEKEYYEAYNAYQASRENVLLVLRVPIGVFIFILGLVLYKKTKEVFSVAAISYGSITSTISGSLFLFRSVGDWAVAVLLFVLSLAGLIYVTKLKK